MSGGNEDAKSLCWDCSRATGGCTWSAALIPVPGSEYLTVFRSDRKGGIEPGRTIIKCPKFDRDATEYGRYRDKPGVPVNKKGQGKIVLSRDDVIGIRKMISAGVPTRQIAAEYGVHTSTVYNIRSGKTHKDVTAEEVSA